MNCTTKIQFHWVIRSIGLTKGKLSKKFNIVRKISDKWLGEKCPTFGEIYSGD